MRTQEETVVRIAQVQAEDFFGTETGDLVFFLDFDHAKPFLKEGLTREEWTPKTLDRETVLTEMRSYMDFAWDKATNHRGLSASRSISHYRAWLWLLADDEALEFANTECNYAQYGAPILMYISKKFGFEIPEGESVERMAEGSPCSYCCQEGCG